MSVMSAPSVAPQTYGVLDSRGAMMPNTISVSQGQPPIVNMPPDINGLAINDELSVVNQIRDKNLFAIEPANHYTINDTLNLLPTYKNTGNANIDKIGANFAKQPSAYKGRTHASIVVVPAADVHINEMYKIVTRREWLDHILPRIPNMAGIMHINKPELRIVWNNVEYIMMIPYQNPPNYEGVIPYIEHAFYKLTRECKVTVYNIVVALPYFEVAQTTQHELLLYMPLLNHITYPIDTALENTIRIFTMSIWRAIRTQPKIIWIPPMQSLINNNVSCDMETLNLNYTMEYKIMNAIHRDFPFSIVWPQHDANINILRQRLNHLYLPHLIPLPSTQLAPIEMPNHVNLGTTITNHLEKIVPSLMEFATPSENIDDNSSRWSHCLRQPISNYIYSPKCYVGASARHIFLEVHRRVGANFALHYGSGIYCDMANRFGSSFNSVTNESVMEWGTIIVRQNKDDIEIITASSDLIKMKGQPWIGASFSIPLTDENTMDINVIRFEFFMTRPQIIVIVRDGITNYPIWQSVLKQTDPCFGPTNTTENDGNSMFNNVMPYFKIFPDAIFSLVLTPLIPWDLLDLMVNQNNVPTLNKKNENSHNIATFYINKITSVDISTPFHPNMISAPLLPTSLNQFNILGNVPFSNGLSSLFCRVQGNKDDSFLNPDILHNGSMQSIRFISSFSGTSSTHTMHKLLGNHLTITPDALKEFDIEHFSNNHVNYDDNLNENEMQLLHKSIRFNDITGRKLISINDLLVGGARLYVPLSSPTEPILTMLSDSIVEKNIDAEGLEFITKINQGVGIIWTYFKVEDSGQQQINHDSMKTGYLYDTARYQQTNNEDNDTAEIDSNAYYHYAIILIDLRTFTKRLLYKSKAFYKLRHIPLCIEFDEDDGGHTNFSWDYSFNMGMREAQYMSDDNIITLNYNLLRKVKPVEAGKLLPFYTNIVYSVVYPYTKMTNNLMMPFIWQPSAQILHLDVLIDGQLSNTQWYPKENMILSRSTENIINNLQNHKQNYSKNFESNRPVINSYI